MSATSEQVPTTPNDPLHYAPRRLREKTDPSMTARGESQSGREAGSGPAGRAAPPTTPLDSALENAVYQSLRRSLDPEVIQTAGFLRGDRRKALFGALAIGVSALAALFVVLMVHASQEPNVGASFAAAVQSMKAAQQQQSDSGSRPALAEFRGLIDASEAQPATEAQPTTQESDKLLQQFMQWRQKTYAAERAQ
jgi:hypothetical protein